MSVDKTEPVLIAGLTAGGVLTLVEAIFALGKGLGYWDDTTSMLWMTFFRTVLPLLAGAGAALWARQRVTPVANPKDVDGTRLKREDGSDPIKVEEEKQKEGTA